MHWVHRTGTGGLLYSHRLAEAADRVAGHLREVRALPPFQEALDAFSTRRTDEFVREVGEEVGLRPVPPPSTRAESIPTDTPDDEDLDAATELIDSLAAYLILAELHLTGDCQDVARASKALPNNWRGQV